jgi:hypothetical protein
VVPGRIAELEPFVGYCMVVRCSLNRGRARKRIVGAADATIASDQAVLATDMPKAVEEGPAAPETVEVAADVERGPKAIVAQ